MIFISEKTKMNWKKLLGITFLTTIIVAIIYYVKKTVEEKERAILTLNSPLLHEEEYFMEQTFLSQQEISWQEMNIDGMI